MRLRTLAGTVLLATLTLCLCASDVPPIPPASPGLEDVPVVVAEVNGKQLFRHDLIRELVGACTPDALDRLVKRVLVEQAAKEEGVTVTDADIELQFKNDIVRLNEEMVDMPFTRKDSQKKLPIEELIQGRYRMTVSEYKNLVVRQRLLIKRALVRDLSPTDTQLVAYFEANVDRFQTPIEYKAAHILITPWDLRDLQRGQSFRSRRGQAAVVDAERHERNVAHGNDATARRRTVDQARDYGVEYVDAPNREQYLDPALRKSEEKATRLLRDIRANVISWDQALKQYTQDPLDKPYMDDKGKQTTDRQRANMGPGVVGKFTKLGPLVPQFYEGVKNLRPGEIGGPVRTPYGYHLVKMLEVTPRPAVKFDTIRAQIRDAYLEDRIQALSGDWMEKLVLRANIKTERAQLWPPLPTQRDQTDPVVGSVNGVPFKRSQVWRELLRSEGEEALNRLINMEVVLTMLKVWGLERLDWTCSSPESQANSPPPLIRPIRVSSEAIDFELNTDRLRLDKMNEAIHVKEKNAPDIELKDYIFQRYGQSVENYKRKLEAGLVLRNAIRGKVPTDEDTLRVQFAMARDQFNEPTWYEVSHILIQAGGNDSGDRIMRGQAKLIAEEVYRAFLADPDSFPDLVKRFSQCMRSNTRGGYLGACYPFIQEEDLSEMPLIYEEIRKQKIQRGQATSPIETNRGFHIARVGAMHPERRAEFHEVKGRIERAFLNERAKMYTEIWLQSLNKQAKIRRFIFESKTAQNDEMPPDNFKVPKAPK